MITGHASDEMGYRDGMETKKKKKKKGERIRKKITFMGIGCEITHTHTHTHTHSHTHEWTGCHATAPLWKTSRENIIVV